MDTYKLQQAILSCDLSPTEQHVALVYAVFYNRKKQRIQVSQAKIAELTGYSTRTVRRAVAALEQKGLFTMKQTRRVAILTPQEIIC